jgi:Universal stress protein family
VVENVPDGESFHRLLAILDGEPEEHAHVLARAVELAEAEHATLTLAKTRDVCLLAHCACAFPTVAALPVADSEGRARDVLARTAELIPQSISLRTVLLGDDPSATLRRLLARCDYDLVIAREELLRRRRRLRRVLRGAGVSTLGVVRDHPAAPAPVSPEPARVR